MIIDIGKGDFAECPHCGKEFEIEHLSDDDMDDADEYFEHVSTCDGDGQV